jgi:hypothetical protein
VQPLADPKMFREQVVGQIDDRGLTLTQVAALHALDNTEEVKKQLGDLLTPRPGERLNLDRILTLLEKVAKSQVESEKLLKEVCEKLSALEAQSFVLSATSPSQCSTQNSTG